MEIQIGDMVRTNTGEVGRVRSITEFNGAARYYGLLVFAPVMWGSGLHETSQRRFVADGEIVAVMQQAAISEEITA